MDVVHRGCAGLDVHKKSVVACRITYDPQGDQRSEVRTFGTMTADLLALADWLRAGGVTQVAMESAGVYWKSVFNILEGEFAVLLVNAQHIKHVPGRKSDVNDAQWLADCIGQRACGVEMPDDGCVAPGGDMVCPVNLRF